MRAAGGFLLLLVAGLSLSGLTAQGEGPARLDVGSDVAGPGQEVFLPLTLSAEASAGVTALALELTFPADKLVYEDLLPGAAQEGSRMKASSRLTASEDPGQPSRLRVEISSEEGLPQGELARLSFRISQEAEVNEEIHVKEVLRELETPAGSVEAEGTDGVVTVIAEAFFACFFYMH